MKFTTALLIAASSVLPSAFAAGGGATNLARANLATVYDKCVNNKQVALTFDDGPWVYAYDVSKALVAKGAKGTFFLNGNNYACIYDADEQKRVKYLHDKGHQIGSHTWAHKDLATLSFDQIHDEMYRVELALQRIIGVQPAFMRPPTGSYNNLVREVAYQRNQSLALWDFDSEDSLGASAAKSKQMYKALVDKNPKNILALNHEVYETTAHDVLPYAIDLLQSKGYKLVTLAECLGKAPYQFTAAPQTPSDSWTC